MKVIFKLSDITVPVDESQIVKVGNAELELSTDAHDTDRMIAVMEKGPNYIKDVIGVVKSEVLPFGEMIAEFIDTIDCTITAKKQARREASANDSSAAEPTGDSPI